MIKFGLDLGCPTSQPKANSNSIWVSFFLPKPNPNCEKGCPSLPKIRLNSD